MRIISKFGKFYFDKIERVVEESGVVYVCAGGSCVRISTSPDAFNKICEAIVNNENYVEVD